jgi:hypothetical protein
MSVQLLNAVSGAPSSRSKRVLGFDSSSANHSSIHFNILTLCLLIAVWLCIVNRQRTSVPQNTPSRFFRFVWEFGDSTPVHNHVDDEPFAEPQNEA